MLDDDYVEATGERLSKLIAKINRRPTRNKISASWQRVLGEQVLNTILDTNPVARAAIEASVEQLLEAQPALCDALVAAFDIYDGPDPIPGNNRTPYMNSEWGMIISNKALMDRNRREYIAELNEKYPPPPEGYPDD